MLTHAVESYLALRQAAGFALRSEETLLRGFAAFSSARGESDHSRNPCHRVGRIGILAFPAGAATRDGHPMRAPPPRGGSASRDPTTSVRLREATPSYTIHPVGPADREPDPCGLAIGYRTLRRETYSTLFGLLAAPACGSPKRSSFVLRISPRTAW